MMMMMGGKTLPRRYCVTANWDQSPSGGRASVIGSTGVVDLQLLLQYQMAQATCCRETVARNVRMMNGMKKPVFIETLA